jgi:hypothetical protein
MMPNKPFEPSNDQVQSGHLPSPSSTTEESSEIASKLYQQRLMQATSQIQTTHHQVTTHPVVAQHVDKIQHAMLPIMFKFLQMRGELASLLLLQDIVSLAALNLDIQYRLKVIDYLDYGSSNSLRDELAKPYRSRFADEPTYLRACMGIDSTYLHAMEALKQTKERSTSEVPQPCLDYLNQLIGKIGPVS